MARTVVLNCEADTHAAAVLGKTARKNESVAGTFFRREEAAADQMLDWPEHRLDRDKAVGISFLEFEPVLAQ